MPSKLPEHRLLPLALPHHDEEMELTSREAESMHWVAQGKTNDEIGRILEISMRTVGKHVEHINRKLGTKSRTEAVVYLFVRNQQNSPDWVRDPHDFARWLSQAPHTPASPPRWQTRCHA